MKFKKSELKRLSRNGGLVELLMQEKLDFETALNTQKYHSELKELQIQLIKLQNKIIEEESRFMMIVEGGEFSGKGGLIKAFTEHLNPRSVRTVALPKPTELEKKQWYFRRYINQMPLPGELVFFDRSWYNRAVVEPVHNFCTKKDYENFMSNVNQFEEMVVNDGIIFFKIYLDVSKEEQARRIKEVAKDPLRNWELTSVDKKAQKLWSKFKKYQKVLFENTSTEKNPWHVFESDNQQRMHIEVVKHVLNSMF